MSSYPLYHSAPVSSSYRSPAFGYGTFVTDGAVNDPSVISGTVIGARRLENAGNAFFRVKFIHDMPQFAGQRALDSSMQITVHSNDADTFATCRQLNLSDDGGDVRARNELDFTVESGDTAGPVDTAGFRVDLFYALNRAAKR